MGAILPEALGPSVASEPLDSCGLSPDEVFQKILEQMKTRAFDNMVKTVELQMYVEDEQRSWFQVVAVLDKDKLPTKLPNGADSSSVKEDPEISFTTLALKESRLCLTLIRDKNGLVYDSQLLVVRKEPFVTETWS